MYELIPIRIYIRNVQCFFTPCLHCELFSSLSPLLASVIGFSIEKVGLVALLHIVRLQNGVYADTVSKTYMPIIMFALNSVSADRK